jgi:hypothetical protein
MGVNEGVLDFKLSAACLLIALRMCVHIMLDLQWIHLMLVVHA